MAARKTKPVVNKVADVNGVEAVNEVQETDEVQETEHQEAPSVEMEPAEFYTFRLNLIQLGNEMIDKVRGKQVDVCDGIDKIVSIYNAVK